MDDRNDLFGDDDDFGFDDDLFGGDEDAGGTDDFDFGGDEDFDGDDFDDFGFDEDEDEDFFDDEEEPGGGASRTFVLLAALMIIFFIIGLLAVIVLATRGESVDPFDATSTHVAQVNATLIADIDANNTQVAIDQATADALQATEFAQQTANAATAFAEQTQAVLTEQAQQTQAAVDATSTAIAEQARQTLDAEASLTVEAGGGTPIVQPTQPPQATSGGPIGVSAVEVTATYLAGQFLTLTPSGDVIPTQTSGIAPGTDVVTPTGQLPQTGFLDENLGILALMAFGLMGVVFASRRLRALNN